MNMTDVTLAMLESRKEILMAKMNEALEGKGYDVSCRFDKMGSEYGYVFRIKGGRYAINKYMHTTVGTKKEVYISLGSMISAIDTMQCCKDYYFKEIYSNVKYVRYMDTV